MIMEIVLMRWLGLGTGFIGDRGWKGIEMDSVIVYGMYR